MVSIPELYHCMRSSFLDLCIQCLSKSRTLASAEGWSSTGRLESLSRLTFEDVAKPVAPHSRSRAFSLKLSCVLILARRRPAPTAHFDA